MDQLERINAFMRRCLDSFNMYLTIMTLISLGSSAVWFEVSWLEAQNADFLSTEFNYIIVMVDAFERIAIARSSPNLCCCYASCFCLVCLLISKET